MRSPLMRRLIAGALLGLALGAAAGYGAGRLIRSDNMPFLGMFGALVGLGLGVFIAGLVSALRRR